MLKAIAIVLLLSSIWQEIPVVGASAKNSNQRIHELQSRHNRRFQSDWYSRRSSSPRIR